MGKAGAGWDMMIGGCLAGRRERREKRDLNPNLVDGARSLGIAWIVWNGSVV